MAVSDAKSFCRICSAGCGLNVTIEDGRPVAVRGDRDHALTRGYACFKGLSTAQAHTDPKRLVQPLKRMADGSFVEIGVDDALDEIADRMAAVIDRHGSESIATFQGAGTIQTYTAARLLPALRRAIGTTQDYSNLTIDQSSKFVAYERMGTWGAGKPGLDESDVALFIGCNPLVSHSTGSFLGVDPTRRLKAAVRRGLKLIVIDPRHSETARYASLFLQPYPGEDATIVSGLLREIIDRDWIDHDFCARFVAPGHIERLRAAIDPFTPEYVARRAGIQAEGLRAAAEAFATGGRGSAFSGTGPSMSPACNLSEQLIETINILCGRYRPEGDSFSEVSLWSPAPQPRAQVYPPTRSWEHEEPGRIRGGKRLAIGERFTCNLPDEILTEGDGQVRVLINAGGNPAVSIPDQRKTVRALRALDLLVTVDPFMTATARISDFILPPTMMFERADLPLSLWGLAFFPRPWAQYQAPIVPAPPKIVDEWEYYWGIAKRLNRPLEHEGRAIPMDRKPTAAALIDILAAGSVVPIEEIRRHPGGLAGDHVVTVGSSSPDATARFALADPDVIEEIERVLADPSRVGPGQYRLAVRRSPNTCNSIGVHRDVVQRRVQTNHCLMNPIDLAAMGLASGDEVEVRSGAGEVVLPVLEDDSVRPSVVQIYHCWGGLPDEPEKTAPGVNANLLISLDDDIATINSMARMSAIPVTVGPAQRSPLPSAPVSTTREAGQNCHTYPDWTSVGGVRSAT